MTLRVGLSGAGYVSAFHLQAWRKAGASVVAIADPDVERARERAAAFGISSVHASLAAMLEAGGLDVLDVASPRQVHIEQSRAGLAAGLPVLCQKPVATALEEAESLSAELTEADRFMVHENWRFRPEYRRMAEWVDAGRIGALRHATVTVRTRAMLPDTDGRRPALGRQPFMANEARLLVAEVLIHHLDAARRLCGPLTLRTARLLRTQEDLPGETAALIELDTADGAWVTVSGDMTAPGAPSGAADAVEIVGEAGRIVFDGAMLTLHRVDGREEREDFGPRDITQESFDAAIVHFVEGLASGTPFETDLTENLETLRLVERIYREQDVR